MTTRTCHGTTKLGEPCRANPIRGGDYCLKHDPTLGNERREWSSAGGKGRSNVSRASKRLPEDLKGTLEVLYRALSGLESGDVEATRATAIASVARAIVTVYEVAELELRLQQIERSVTERSA